MTPSSRCHQVGELALDYTNRPLRRSAYGPAVFATVDIDNDGVNDGELLYEEVYNGEWWANRALRNALNAAHLGLVAPAVGGGGSEMNGTVDQWLEAIPDAIVTRVGFTLGSGVHAEGVLKSFTVEQHEVRLRCEGVRLRRHHGGAPVLRTTSPGSARTTSATAP